MNHQISTDHGTGNAIIEICSIGFEPLLTSQEYKLFLEIRALKKRIHQDCYTQKRSFYEKKLSYKKDLLRSLFHKNENTIRCLFADRDFSSQEQYKSIAVFESELTRTFGCQDMEHSDTIISVTAYYTEIFESIVRNGFRYKEKQYVFFTAGAGQLRCKKSTFILKELLHKHYHQLFCGLTTEMINENGGINPNKYLAYTSLCQTNTRLWHGFDIDRAIVVDDITFTLPNQTVRSIYTETPADKKRLVKLKQLLSANAEKLRILREKKTTYPKGFQRPKDEIIAEKEYKDERTFLLDKVDRLQAKYHQASVRKKDISICFTDGFGISLKKMSSSMIRLPFIKGLIAYCPRRAFLEWCTANQYIVHKITDIYGKSHSIKDIDYIFTKSQFKMWSYYTNLMGENGTILQTGWERYQSYFKEFDCHACLCNVEEKVPLNAKTNYQILQTLTTEMTDEDILDLAKDDIECLNGIGRDMKCMLHLLGADEEKNVHLSRLQKSLLLYPEMLKDTYIKTLLKNTKESMVKKFRSGKFHINGAYTFAIPDTLACMQWWFTDMDRQNLDAFGFVAGGTVSCNLFAHEEEIDCLRSPHLDHAHCIRYNQNNEQTKKWTKSSGVYLSMQDIMSKLLMYDNDGDKLLIHNNTTIIRCAKAFQHKYQLLPNDYEMSKAAPKPLTDDALLHGMLMAYHHGNIGTPSNEITKIWMTLHPESKREAVLRAMEVVALRCADVNFVIDYAKTLYKPEIPKHIMKRYQAYSGKPVPHFFLYAKNKKPSQVAPPGLGNIDRISSLVKSNRIVFKNLPGSYSYQILMQNPDISIEDETEQKIVALYHELAQRNLRKLSHVDLSVLDIDDKKRLLLQMELDTKRQRSMFAAITGESEAYIADVLIKSLVQEVNKSTLWKLFGEVIYENIKRNLEGTKLCSHCGNRFPYDTAARRQAVVCPDCASKRNIQKTIANRKNKNLEIQTE